eukprot:11684105-Alexandrium_andersonii.AAC.1
MAALRLWASRARPSFRAFCKRTSAWRLTNARRATCDEQGGNCATTCQDECLRGVLDNRVQHVSSSGRVFWTTGNKPE